jgi:hypothetical protein
MTTTATPALGPAVDALVRVPVGDMCVAELKSLLVSVGGEIDRLSGWWSMAAGELQARTGGAVTTDDGGSRTVVSWLAEARRETPSAVGGQVRTSTALRSMPLVAEAVLDGVLTQAQAAGLGRLVGRIPDEQLAETQPELVLVAKRLNPAELGRWVAELIATHCEPALDGEAETARGRRFLQTSTDGALLRGRFAVALEDGETLLSALEPLARRQGLGDGRSAGQRRADALVEVCEQVLRHGDLPDAGGQRPQLSYVLPADWAARQAEKVACDGCFTCAEHRPPSFADTVAASLPGQLGVPAEHACAVGAWTGPQTRGRIEAMLCDARITRVLLDCVGQVRGLEALTDTVTPSQRRALAARDGGCVARGCTRPPANCDAHHLVARAEGGATSLGNLVLLCRRHHVLWHLGKILLHELHVPWHPDARSTGPP